MKRDQFELYGANGSPYSVKMRAYLRYKHLPFVWRSQQTAQSYTSNAKNEIKNIFPETTPSETTPSSTRKSKTKSLNKRWPARFSHLKAKVIPVLVFPDSSTPTGTDKIKNDSTFLIQEIERGPDCLGFNCLTRPSLPRLGTANAFLSDLIEDFADEWLTKCMYGFRWNRPKDQGKYLSEGASTSLFLTQ